MKFILLLLLSISSFTVLVAQDSDVTPIYDYRIINTFPHDVGAYTQGLIVADGYILEGTGQRGQSSLRKVDLKTGNILQLIELDDQYFGEGVTIFENRIYQLTWQARVGFVYDAETMLLVDEFYFDREGWGLTHDGKVMISSDGTDQLYFFDPHSFQEVRTLKVTAGGRSVGQLNELEYINGEIYANIYPTERIARISPESGEVLGWIEMSGLLSPSERTSFTDVLNGIAYDPEHKRLFVTGKNWPRLFEIEIFPRQ